MTISKSNFGLMTPKFLSLSSNFLNFNNNVKFCQKIKRNLVLSLYKTVIYPPIRHLFNTYFKILFFSCVKDMEANNSLFSIGWEKQVEKWLHYDVINIWIEVYRGYKIIEDICLNQTFAQTLWVIYCCIVNYPEIWQHKTRNIYYWIASAGQESGHSSAGYFRLRVPHRLQSSYGKGCSDLRNKWRRSCF